MQTFTRDEFIADNPIESVLAGRGITVIGSGKQRSARCPFHEDKTASLSINVESQLWKCHAGCGGGSVIDLLARFNQQTPVAFLKANIPKSNGHSQPKTAPSKHAIKAIYSYKDATGREKFQVVRYEPKTFRQRHSDGKDGWIWGMDGVERVLYRLPEVLTADTVALCEGEKDADTLAANGFTATCNVGGAGKWLDAYTEALRDKHVLIFGDNDDPGRKHVELVFQSIAGKVKSAKLIALPDTCKDVSDFLAKHPVTDLQRLIDSSFAFVHGLRLPIHSMVEIEARYLAHVETLASDSLDLGKWLPSLNRLRPLVPGELAMITAGTGVGKTALLQSLAIAAKPLPIILFQFELPEELLFERFVAAANQMPARDVEAGYRQGQTVGEQVLAYHFGHILICCEPRKTVEQIENLILKSELRFAAKPKLVLLDYVQLISGNPASSRYERASQVAEDLKSIAKSTRTIIVIASQVSRPQTDRNGQRKSPGVGLHDAKDSGSLENSCGLVLGVWREPAKTTLSMRVLKSTKGGAGLDINLNFDGPSTRITESSTSQPPHHSDR